MPAFASIEGSCYFSAVTDKSIINPALGPFINIGITIAYGGPLSPQLRVVMLAQ